MQTRQPRTGIEALVDQACGFNANDVSTDIADTIELLERKIELERFIEADTSHTENFLQRLKELQAQNA